MTANDIEALHPRVDRRTWCQRGCLVASLVLLFVLLLAATLTVTVVMMDIQRELAEVKEINNSRLESQPWRQNQIGEQKVRQSAYLKPLVVHPCTACLANMTVTWQLQNPDMSVATYDKTGAVEVNQSATYLMYLDVAARCPHGKDCSKGTVTLHVEDDTHSSKLDCQVVLPHGNPAGGTHVNSCVSVLMLSPSERLLTKMAVRGAVHWKLDQDRSMLGLILVDKL